jgi:hypothetical protein
MLPPFSKNLRIQSLLAFHLLAAIRHRRQHHGTAQSHQSSKVFRSAPQPAAPLLESRIKSSRELQTIREMVGSKNSEWGATRI